LSLSAFRWRAIHVGVRSRFAGRANIAHTRRDLHDRTDVFAVYSI